MAGIDGDLICEMLKRIDADVVDLKQGQREIKAEMVSLRETEISVQQDVNNIHGMLAMHEHRLDHIESPLDLREFSKFGQRPFDPKT